MNSTCNSRECDIKTSHRTIDHRKIEDEWKPSTCACKHGTDDHYFMKNGINRVTVCCLQCVPGSRCIE